MTRCGIVALAAALLSVGCGSGAREIRSDDTVEGHWAGGDSAQGGRLQAWNLSLDRALVIAIELAAQDSGEVEVGLATRGDTAWATAEYGTARLIQRVDDAGGHRIIARRPHGGDAAYRLAIQTLQGDFRDGQGWVAIEPGLPVHGLLEPRDQGGEPQRYGRIGIARSDLYAFRADSGSYHVVLRSDDFDAQLGMLAPGGMVLDDDGGGGTDARLSLTARAPDTVRLVVSSFGTRPQFGRYLLSVASTTGEFATAASRSAAALWPAHRVCEGKPINTSPPFDSTRAGLHSMVVVGAQVYGGPRVFAAPELYPDERRSPELVLCLTRNDSVLGTCYYQGPSIDRVQNRWRGRLVAARTARVVTEATVEGDLPRRCESRELMTLTRIDGSLGDPVEAAKSMFGVLGRHVGVDSTSVAAVRFSARDGDR